MNIAFFNGIVASAAGTPLALSKGTDVERSQHADAAQKRESVSQLKAEAAAGVGELDDADHKPEERDADGRRLWERFGKKNSGEEPGSEPAPVKQVRDLSGECGNQLDLSG